MPVHKQLLQWLSRNLNEVPSVNTNQVFTAAQQARTTATLVIHLAAGDTDATLTIPSNYSSVSARSTSNITSVDLQTINNAAVNIPFSAVQGSTLRLNVTPTDTSLPSSITYTATILI